MNDIQNLFEKLNNTTKLKLYDELGILKKEEKDIKDN